MTWFQMDKDGQKYFSEFTPITYSNELFQWMKEKYEKTHPHEDKLIAWMNTEEGQKYEKEGSEIFKEEQDRANAHSPALIGWSEMLQWLKSKDGQIYLKALSEIAPFPHQFHMFVGTEKGQWAITPSIKGGAISIKKNIKSDKTGASQ